MHVILPKWLLILPNLLNLHFTDWILHFLLRWASRPRALRQPSAVQVQLEPGGCSDEHNAVRHLPAQRKGEGCSWYKTCGQIQTCSNCLTKSRLFLPDTEALSCWLSCLCSIPSSSDISQTIFSVPFSLLTVPSMACAYSLLFLQVVFAFGKLTSRLLCMCHCWSSCDLLQHGKWLESLLCAGQRAWLPRLSQCMRFLTSENLQLEWGGSWNKGLVGQRKTNFPPVAVYQNLSALWVW